LEDLDARVASASVHRRIAKPLPGLAAVDIEAGVSRTANRHGYDDLSSRGAYARLGLESNLAGFDASFALSGQWARFDASLLEEMPARRDRFTLVEIGVAREFSKDLAVRADFTWGRNVANVAIYDNRIRALSLTLVAAF
jgi:hypothetical protein